ncbi:MAG: hypothetical protein AB7D43_09335 [Sulfurimonadaceae bacterium]
MFQKFLLVVFFFCSFGEAALVHHRDKTYDLKITPNAYDPSHRPIPTLGASPLFTNNTINIQESIRLSIDANSTSAMFINEYEFFLKEATTIPFLLVPDEETLFDVRIDGEKVAGVFMEAEKLYDNETFSDFNHYGVTYKDAEFLLYRGTKFGELDRYARSFLVYTKPLEKGKHKALIAFRAYPYVERNGWTEAFVYRHSFVPSSFYDESYNVSVDIISHDTKRTFFLDMKPFTQSFPVALDTIDRDTFRIVCNPIISQKAQQLLETKPSGFMLIAAAVFLILHLALLYRIPFMRRFFMLIAASLLAGYIILRTNFYAIEAIDRALGEFAHATHGYISLLWLSYPFVSLVYLFMVLIFVSLFKKIQK